MRRLIAALVVLTAPVAILPAQDLLAVWRNPEVLRLNFAGKKVAALVITDDQPLQISGEEALTRELTALGVNGAATYRFVPREELKTADTARPWFERAGVEGVVALRPVSRETERSYSPVVWSSGYYPTFWGYYGYGWSTVYVAPLSTRQRTVIVVETLVYDVTGDRLVWAATSETKDPENLQRFIGDLVDAAVGEMKKMKLVG
jgi:hypothetical protein